MFCVKFTESESENNNDDGIFLSGGITIEEDFESKSSFEVPNNDIYKLNLKTSKWEHLSELKSKRAGH